MSCAGTLGRQTGWVFIAPATEAPSTTYRGVQALRFLSALLVVALHACYWVNRDAGSGAQAPSSALLGDVCVSVFFLISGFVVVLVIDSGREPDWQTFALRRAIRILPLAWLMTTTKIVAAVVAPGAMFDGALTPVRVLTSFLLVPSRGQHGIAPMLWGVEWTLVFEAAFYFLVTAAMAVRIDPVRSVSAVLVLFAILAAWRPDEGSAIWFYANPLVLFLVAGMSIARAVRSGQVLGPIATCSALTALIIAIGAVRSGPAAVSAVVFALLTITFALVVSVERRYGSRLPDWVVMCGDSAFALYLTHPLVAQVLPRALGWFGVRQVPWFPVVVVSVVASVGLGIAVHRCIDRPVGRFLRGRLVRTDAASDRRSAPA